MDLRHGLLYSLIIHRELVDVNMRLSIAENSWRQLQQLVMNCENQDKLGLCGRETETPSHKSKTIVNILRLHASNNLFMYQRVFFFSSHLNQKHVVD